MLVNLYIPSRLNWREKGMALTMNTRFPESDTISVSIDKKGDYTGSFLFRYPAWVDGEAVVLINGEEAKTEAHKGNSKASKGKCSHKELEAFLTTC